MSSRVKREVMKKFQHYGLALQKDALMKMIELKSECATDEDFNQLVEQLGNLILSKNLQTTRISMAEFGPALDKITSNDNPIENDILNIVDSFQLQKFQYKRVRKLFFPVKNGDIHGKAQELSNIFRDRYELLLQRVLRHKTFEKSTFKSIANSANNNDVNGMGAPDACNNTLTSTAELIGTKGMQTVFGMLCELEEGKLFLEDVNGSVEINIENCNKDMGLYTWGSFVLIQGKMDSFNNVFHVSHMKNPFGETRFKTVKMFKSLNFVPFDKQKLLYEHQARSDDETFIFVSNIYLDTESSLQKLETLLSGYSQCDVPPSLFVFMGNFTHCPMGCNPKDMKKLKGYFDKFCDIILKHSKLVRHSKFLIIPGPNDPSVGHLLPMPRLLPSLTRKLETKLNCVCASNPCRIRFCTQEIVVFRYDLLCKMRRNCVTVPNLLASMDLSEHLAHTVVNQSCLVPLPLQIVPVYWNYSHALELYPNPDLLVIADSHEEYKCRVNDDTVVVCPGEFDSQGTFLAYTPCDKEVDFSQLDRYQAEEQDQKSVDVEAEVAQAPEDLSNNENVNDENRRSGGNVMDAEGVEKSSSERKEEKRLSGKSGKQMGSAAKSSAGRKGYKGRTTRRMDVSFDAQKMTLDESNILNDSMFDEDNMDFDLNMSELNQTDSQREMNLSSILNDNHTS